MSERCVEHSFSIELKSKEFVKNLSFSNKIKNYVLFEGVLGEFKEISIVEEKVFEFKGKNGTLRLDLCPKELQELFQIKKSKD